MRNLFDLSFVQPGGRRRAGGTPSATLVPQRPMLDPSHPTAHGAGPRLAPVAASARGATAGVETPRPRCLIVLAHPERGLSNTLLQHLQQELAGVELTLRDEGAFDVVWFCGYESSAAADSGARLVDVRRQHPEAGLLVTGRVDAAPWEDDALAAGADRVRRWPLSMDELRDELGRLIRARAPRSRAG